MVDEREVLKQYTYKATSNLVIEQERRRRGRADPGVVPLQAETMPGRMGDKTPTIIGSGLGIATSTQPAAVPVPIAGATTANESNIVDVAEELELQADEAPYLPTSQVSRRAYEALLAFVTSKIGDQPRDLLRSYAEEIIVSMKDEHLAQPQKKSHAQNILGHKLTSAEFARLALVTRPLTDFHADGSEIEAAAELAVIIDNEEGHVGEPEEVVNVPIDTDAPELAFRDSDGITGTSKADAALSDSHIDAEWLHRQLASAGMDLYSQDDAVRNIVDILLHSAESRVLENRLVELLSYDRVDLITSVVENRNAILPLLMDACAQTPEERRQLEARFKDRGADVDSSDQATRSPNHASEYIVEPTGARRRNRPSDKDSSSDGSADQDSVKRAPHLLDLESLTLHHRSFHVSNLSALPTGSEHIELKDYEEWHIPAAHAPPEAATSQLISVGDLPDWVQPAFPATKQFNRMQSEVFHFAFLSLENMLLCAPTGAGKTNVAMLAILGARQASHSKDSSQTTSQAFEKAVYVAPMKALVSEVVGNLSKRLGGLNVVVRELTGDVNLSSQELREAGVIVTTPEKWDIVSRKNFGSPLSRSVRLLIIDEVHLLHDERGPVLESIVARTRRSNAHHGTKTRIVALSATLPNYRDVGQFLVVKSSGMFFFDATHRPCPLQQCFVGITAIKSLKRFRLQNELTFEKIKLHLQEGNQVIVFVHSRKETSATCQYLVNRAMEDEISDLLLKPESASHEIILQELAAIASQDLRTCLEQGLAIHHAGLTRSDRQLVEALFEKGHVKVLVSTATLAWGVNLPAHAVIIKGTQLYSPEQGRWVDLSAMDVMQMMGRAGRPQFDTHGQGYIISSKRDVIQYLSVLNDQLPIESRFVSRLADMLNAEVSIGTVSSVADGATWLSYTYLHARMRKSPKLYGVRQGEVRADPSLLNHRESLIHSAATELQKAGLARYDRATGEILGTQLGQIAADFYISYHTMSMYMNHMKSSNTEMDILKLFAMSGEFRNIRVRDEEKLELLRLTERVPIPVSGPVEDPTAKIIVLTQAYVSRLSLEGLALKADMVYVTQSASRLFRALLHVALLLKKAVLFEKCLNLTKAIATRQWASQTPLWQFADILGGDVLHRIERKDVPFERYYDLEAVELGELLRDQKLGRSVHRLIHTLPRLHLEADVRPTSRASVEVRLAVQADFRFNGRFHGSGEAFWVTAEDADSETILYSQWFFLRPSLANTQHELHFALPLTTPRPPQYFLRCFSDRWIVPESALPLYLQDLILPDKHEALLPLPDTRLSTSTAVRTYLERTTSKRVEEAGDGPLTKVQIYLTSCLKELSPLLSLVAPTLLGSDENALVATMPGSERDLCGELSVARLFSRTPAAVAVWIVGEGGLPVHEVQHSISCGIGRSLGLHVVLLESEDGDVASLRLPGTLIVTDAQRWDRFSRRWRQKKEAKVLGVLGLVILDGIHELADARGGGPAFEVLASRMRYFFSEAKQKGRTTPRIVALSDPIANASAVGHWLGASPAVVFPFHPRTILKDVAVHMVPCASLRKFTPNAEISMLARSIHSAFVKHAVIGGGRRALVFLPSRSVLQSLSRELVMCAKGEYDSLHVEDSASFGEGFSHALRLCLAHGYGFIHSGMGAAERAAVQEAFDRAECRVLLTTVEFAYRKTLFASVVVVVGTSVDRDGCRVMSGADYSASDLRRMVCHARNPENDIGQSTVLLIAEPDLQKRCREQIFEPVALESLVHTSLADHLNAEIASEVVQTKQDAVDFLTWTFYYRRLPKNPNYYGLRGLSPEEVSAHLSELVETALSELEGSKCVALEGDDDVALGALNFGFIAAHHYVRHETVEFFASSVSPRMKLRGVLDTISLAYEFRTLPFRSEDIASLESLLSKVQIAAPFGEGSAKSVSSMGVKIHLLLQSHLNRIDVEADLDEDRRRILVTSIRLLRAFVDVVSTVGWLKPALAAIELSQMIVQGLWDPYPLMQLPHIDRMIACALSEQYGVTDIFEFLDMESVARAEALRGLSNRQVSAIAAACDKFPNLEDLKVQSAVELSADETTVSQILVEIRRSEDHGQEITDVPEVMAPRFPVPKTEGWWIIVGDSAQNTVLTLKHVRLKRRAVVKLSFATPEVLVEKESRNCQVFLMSDSYLDCDQEERVTITAATADV